MALRSGSGIDYEIEDYSGANWSSDDGASDGSTSDDDWANYNNEEPPPRTLHKPDRVSKRACSAEVSLFSTYILSQTVFHRNACILERFNAAVV